MRAMTIYKNGTEVLPGRRFSAVGGGDNTDVGMSRYISVASGDTLSISTLTLSFSPVAA